MRVPLSWLREYVDLPATETGRDVQAKLISAGLEVETVEQLGADLKGPLVVDVNEQNPQALQFYLAEGFQVVGRSELDGGGRPFPLLHLREASNDD